MKKIVFILFIVLLLIIIIIDNDNKMNRGKEDRKINKEDKEMKGLFFSYIEESNYFKNKSDNEIKKNIAAVIKNIKDNHFNTLILQVRSFSDALYHSNIFPQSIDTKIDILDEFIKQARKNRIKIYAWINPYRISNTATTEISKPAKEWLNTKNVKVLKNGVYYNPASLEVRNLIVDGVIEIVKNYNIDGIIFDDYFYPSDTIDLDEYYEYKKTNDNVSLAQFHIDNVNLLIKDVYKNIKEINKKVEFGISPDGNNDNNYNKNYADVKKWCENDEYIDFIMPQIYYGFNNSTKPYIETINEWSNIVKNNNIDLYFALAFYKVGNIDEYAKEGKNEWIENDDIIMRQIIVARNNEKYHGFALFRYDNIFNSNIKTSTSDAEYVNLQKLL